MNGRTYCCLLVIILCLSLTGMVGAADLQNSFMYEDQDYVIVGKITGIEHMRYDVAVSELIIASSKRLDVPDTLEIAAEQYQFEVGDCIAASVNRSDGCYVFANGAYAVTTNDTDTLEVVDAQNNPDLTALEVFLRSRGRKADFYSDSSTAYMYDNPNRASDEDICIYSPDTGKNIPADLPQNSKHPVLQRYEPQDMIQVILLALGGIAILLLGIAVLMRYGTHSSRR